MRAPSTAAALLFLAMPSPALAVEVRTGYQLGAAESVGTTVSNSRDLVQGPVVVGGEAAPPRASAITRFNGLQLTTGVTADLTFDLPTGTLNQALLLGTGFSQILPAFVPDGAYGAVQQRITTAQATAQYVSKLEQPSWGLAYGGGYTLSANGRLATNPDGSVSSNTPQGPVVPGTQVSAFVVNGLSHTVTARTELQIVKSRWDLSFVGSYRYSIAGIFSLAPGGSLVAPGTLTPGDPSAAGQNTPTVLGATGTNIGAFTRATTHFIAPSLTFRQAVGERGHVTASAYSAINLPVSVEDLKIGSGTNGLTFPAPVLLPDTVITNGSLGYLYRTIRDRMFGGRALATFGTRVKTDPITQAPLAGAPLSPDWLMIGARAIYGETLPWELRVDLEVGAAQPYLFQAPLGYVPFNARFDPIHADWTPVFALTAHRKFDPIDLSLSLSRDLGPGATGAVAFVNESVSLAGLYAFHTGERAGKLLFGVSYTQRHGYGRELYRPQPEPATPRCDPKTLPAGQLCPAFVNPFLFFDNRAFGANAALSVRLYRDGDLAVDGIGSYNLAWLDPDTQGLQPNLDGTVGRPPSLTHFALFTIRGTYGRGPLADIERREIDELSAFSVDPASGSPLISNRLLREGAPLLQPARGVRPGQPPREEYERQRRLEQTTNEARPPASDVVRGNATIEEEEAEAQKHEAEEREERQKRRTRKFSEWPMDAVPLDQQKDEKPDAPPSSADSPKD